METKMDEIQTRANVWAEKRTMPKSQLAHAVICYMNGALDQREIDIQRACKWLEEKLNEIGFDECEFGWDNSEDVLEDFKQTMKGE